MTDYGSNFEGWGGWEILAWVKLGNEVERKYALTSKGGFFRFVCL